MTTYLYKNLSGSHGSPVFRDNAGAHSVLQLLSDASADGSEAASNTEAAAANAAVSGSAASAASASGNSKTAARQGEYSEVRGSESAKQKDGGGKNLKNSSAENLKSSMKNGYGTLYAKDSKIRSKPCPVLKKFHRF